MGRIRRITQILGSARRASPAWWAIPRYASVIRTILPYTMVPYPRLEVLMQLARDLEQRAAQGCIVECGTCNGGTGGLLAWMTRGSNRPVWLFDSFEGLPEPEEIDGEEAEGWAGRCYGQEERVHELLRKLGQDDDRVRTVKGWFEDTLPSADVGPIALLHIDADWYRSVKQVLDRFYDDVIPGGYIVLDDYGHWEGCQKATDEFLRDRGLDVELTVADYAGRWFQKPHNTRGASGTASSSTP